MGLLQILDQAKKVRTEAEAGNYMEAWRQTLPLQEELIQLGQNVGFKAGPDDEEAADAIKCELEKAVECCDKAAPKGKAKEVGKLFPGDGSFLKIILEAVMKFLPLFIAPKPE